MAREKSPAQTRFEDIIKSSVTSVLKPLGFRKTGLNFHRRSQRRRSGCQLPIQPRYVLGREAIATSTLASRSTLFANWPVQLVIDQRIRFTTKVGIATCIPRACAVNSRPTQW